MERNKFQKENELSSNPLNQFFYQIEKNNDSPFSLALSAYQALRKEAKTGEGLFYYLIEDSLFSSLNATFHEQLILTLSKNKQYLIPLIEKYSEETETREKIIDKSVQDHLNFIENHGVCNGCPSCENHTDVTSLIEPYQKGELDFFTELYIGMQTIQFTMEYFIYDELPQNEQLLDSIEQKTILDSRKLIYNYSKMKIDKYLKDI